jgi:hypothetical protein
MTKRCFVFGLPKQKRPTFHVGGQFSSSGLSEISKLGKHIGREFSMSTRHRQGMYIKIT